jgi:hypothetical protein
MYGYWETMVCRQNPLSFLKTHRSAFRRRPRKDTPLEVPTLILFASMLSIHILASAVRGGVNNQGTLRWREYRSIR